MVDVLHNFRPELCQVLPAPGMRANGRDFNAIYAC